MKTMSVIQDAETVQEEDVYSEGDNAKRIPANGHMAASMLSVDEQNDMLRNSILKRASILKEEEI